MIATHSCVHIGKKRAKHHSFMWTDVSTQAKLFAILQYYNVIRNYSNNNFDNSSEYILINQFYILFNQLFIKIKPRLVMMLFGKTPIYHFRKCFFEIFTTFWSGFWEYGKEKFSVLKKVMYNIMISTQYIVIFSCSLTLCIWQHS